MFSPLLSIMVLAHFTTLARHRFVCIALEGSSLVITTLSTKRVRIDSLKSVEVSKAALVFLLDGGARIEIGRLGLIGGTKAAVEGLLKVKPELAVQAASS